MPAATLARSVLLEARRGGLPWLAGASLVLALALAAFVSQVALTERAALQTALVAAVLRACAVFLIAAQVTSSTLREIHDKGLELMLSLPLSRAAHYLGRLAGFVVCGAGVAVVFTLPLLLWAPPLHAAVWGASLACEAALVAAAALFFAMTLANLVAAIAATAGLYLLARAMPAIQAIAAAPLAEESWAGWLARHTVVVIALFLPRLDAVTRTEWLLYDVPSMLGYGAALVGLVVYTLLLVAAGLVDFYRRSV
jgi:ABC-type transport system involved in multi-copper enzyme maturation permease subunit